jgi:hypothetical protein
MSARGATSSRGPHAAAAALLAAAVMTAAPALATTITVVNADAPGEGFNDPTPVAAVDGNPATTLGGQRLHAFAAAAAYWAERLDTTVDVVVQAKLDPLACSPTGALLGSAGPTAFYRDFAAAPRARTWYPAALAGALRGASADAGSADIVATFSSSLTGDLGCLGGRAWSYAVGAAAAAGTVSFYDVVRHEIAHGLGFMTVVNLGSGARALDVDDVYMTMLEDHGSGKRWTEMSNAERHASARDSGDLHWVGPLAVAAGDAVAVGRHPGGHLQMYAPVAASGGSSVSHWDSALFPDELMEPFSRPAAADLVSTALLGDLGWPLHQGTGCRRDDDTACLRDGRFEVEVTWSTATESGPARVMRFGGQRSENDESAFWWFFAPTNFELGVKVLDGCAVNGRHWVFLSGLTDQGWTVRVRDLVSGAERRYQNEVATLSTTFADTAAFACP